MHRLIGCLALSACSFTHGALGSGIDAGDSAISDVARDGLVDVPTGPFCIGTGTYEVCMAMAPALPRALPLAINTSNSTECEATQPAGWITAGQPESCFVIGSSITMSAGVRVSGSRPLVLAASDSITISFVVDGASHRGGSTGPGSPFATCIFQQTPVDDSSGAPGGAGATFMTKGGDGGDGFAGKTEGRSSNVGAAPTILRAGCAGQPGGQGDGAPGAVGLGGGVIYLVAGNTITITSAINVSGSGAAATTETKTGGSGGGSGGMIKLYAPTINADGATLMANGGGGASGDGEVPVLDGNPGSDPDLSAPTSRASGGASGANLGGAGGGGYALGNAAIQGQPGTLNNTGGGGGGGGGGFIQSNVALTATCSPAATVP